MLDSFPGIIELGEWKPRHEPTTKDFMSYVVSVCATFDLPFEQTTYGADVRPPAWHLERYDQRRFDNVSVCDWHADDPNFDGSGKRLWMAVWASVCCTEFLSYHGQAFQPLDSHVVLFQNAMMRHRTPPLTQSQRAQRWFARMALTSESQRRRDYLNESVYQNVGYQR